MPSGDTTVVSHKTHTRTHTNKSIFKECQNFQEPLNRKDQGRDYRLINYMEPPGQESPQALQ